MNEIITCPCCGSEDIQVRGHYDNDIPCHCFNCPCEWDEDERQPLDALEAELRSRWIACSERLPNKGNPNEYFIVCNVHGNISMDAHLGHNIWDSMMQVTHWQSRPQLPKTESEV